MFRPVRAKIEYIDSLELSEIDGNRLEQNKLVCVHVRPVFAIKARVTNLTMPPPMSRLLALPSNKRLGKLFKSKNDFNSRTKTVLDNCFNVCLVFFSVWSKELRF